MLWPYFMLFTPYNNLLYSPQNFFCYFFENFFYCLSGMRWAAKNRLNTMRWHDAKDSCTCSCTLTGRRGPTPRVARRGSVNKRLMKEVHTPHFTPFWFFFFGLTSCTLFGLVVFYNPGVGFCETKKRNNIN